LIGEDFIRCSRPERETGTRSDWVERVFQISVSAAARMVITRMPSGTSENDNIYGG